MKLSYFATAAVLATTLCAQQGNSQFSSMVIDSNDGPNYPMNINVRTNTTSTIIVSGFNNSGFIIYRSTSGNLQAGAATAFGGHVDLPVNQPLVPCFDSFAQGLTTNVNGQFILNVAIPGNTSLNFHQALQAVIQNPTSPSFLSLTAATRVTVIQGPIVQNLTLGDDGIQAVNTQSVGFQVPFYGVNQSIFNICANGFTCLNGSDSSYTSTPAQFQSGPPRLSAFWADLDQNLGGTIRYTLDGAPGLPIYPYIFIEFLGVPDYSGVGYAHTFSMYADSTGYAALNYPFSNNGSIFETMIGITPGNGLATNSIMKDLSAILTAGTYQSAVGEDFFEWFGLTTMPYYSLGVNRPYDLIGKTLNFSPAGAGNLPAATNRYYLYP